MIAGLLEDVTTLLAKAKLSDRLRPDCEAAPWVIEEIKKRESEISLLVRSVEFLVRQDAEIGRLTDDLNKLQCEVRWSAGLKCRDCDDTGCYGELNEYGDLQPRQCEFCYTVEDSVFNRNNASEVLP